MIFCIPAPLRRLQEHQFTVLCVWINACSVCPSACLIHALPRLTFDALEFVRCGCKKDRKCMTTNSCPRFKCYQEDPDMFGRVNVWMLTCVWVFAGISSVSLGLPFDFEQQNIPLIRQWMVQVRPPALALASARVRTYRSPGAVWVADVRATIFCMHSRAELKAWTSRHLIHVRVRVHKAGHVQGGRKARKLRAYRPVWLERKRGRPGAGERGLWWIVCKCEALVGVAADSCRTVE